MDPGERRTGVAIADNETRWARPLEVIDARERDPVARIAELVSERGVELVVVGRPLHLSGAPGAAVDAQQEFVSSLRAAIEVSVEEFDERLTSVAAGRRLREAGVTAKRQKDMKDAVAAQLMLQDYLDARS
ncbi:MAG: Holliday junction resolvase RuvX [Actinomycetota bacterium]|nr:Holliday junction resolvase RuvX [Actinomycetota bacterium]